MLDTGNQPVDAQPAPAAILADRVQAALAGAERVHERDLLYLQQVVDGAPTPDPYQRSACYFGLTGRNGLWIVEGNDSAVLICVHPQRRQELLLFSPWQSEGIRAHEEVVDRLWYCGLRPHLARMEPDTVKRESGGAFRFERHREELLDWRYPVHVISGQKIVERRGPRFQKFRARLSKLELSQLFAIDLCPDTHRMHIEHVLRRWAHDDAELTAPYMRLLKLFEYRPLHGRLLFHDGTPAGFSIYESPSVGSNIAHVFANIGCTDIEGMARFVVLDMCEAILARNTDMICLGGSETKGLDDFKRSLRPVRSVELESWRVYAKC